MYHKNYFFVLFIALLFNSCSEYQKSSPVLFTRLPGEESGIHFNNTITESPDDSTLILEFAYMGGGVGIGDFNNDGLKDIYFTGNQVSSRLYISKGNNRYEDITEKAGVGTNVWATGVSIADVNADGFDDIYVCTFGKNLQQRTKNLLFINQHNLTFKEESAAYNLDDSSYSTQAAFFDYDRDGDLDMYLLNYMLNGPNANSIYPRNLTGSSPANDKLFRNDGAHFTDVTKEAGIKDDGYGLGIVISDLNDDSWPDIYVSDDFLSNDFLWINNKNGTFTNQVSSAMKHQSYSGMGVDAADLNNDRRTDIVTVDMLPENNERKKISYSFMNYERYQMERAMNYEPEFMRNMLQLNNGVRSTGVPYFSEIGQLAGISETDWSWSVLIADFDNDCHKDIHITNGIGRDFINADFVQFTSTVAGMGDETARKKIIKEKLAALEHVKLQNYFYRNNDDLTFTHISDSAGLNDRSMSNGAAWADLDNDGDLDLVVNNINDEAFVYINNTDTTQHYLQFELRGDSANRHAFGTKIGVLTGDSYQEQELSPVRGYLSTVDTKITFGLGKNTSAEMVSIVWPNGKRTILEYVAADTLITVYKELEEAQSIVKSPGFSQLFQEINAGISYLHKETEFNDFGVQRLLPQKYSQLGPFITTGDINGDGLEDFFVGGGFNSSGKFFIQQANGSFTSKSLNDDIKMQEDMDCLLFDADGDKDLDLIVTCGDVKYEENSPYYVPRLYTNDGKGNFTLNTAAIPLSVGTIAGCVVAADYDTDGDNDLFIGGRVAKQYPLSPKSFTLQNDKGIFKDVTAAVCAPLQRGGMITAAVWTDLDNDKQPDLVVAGEWMPIRFFKNNKGRLEEMPGLKSSTGMWRSLATADIDKDGDMDLVAGNLGMNCNYHVSAKFPMKLFAKDIDNNGSIDPVMFYYIKTENGQRKLSPAIGKDILTSQVPALKKKFVHHKEYINTGVDDIFSDKTNLLELTCEETATCYIENLGNGIFFKHILPAEAQFAPVNTILCDDFDKDGHTDLLFAGNEYQTEVMTGRYDASYGLFLKGNSGRGFLPYGPAQSGFIVDGDVKNMKLLNTPKAGKLVLVAVNNDSLRTFRVELRQPQER